MNIFQKASVFADSPFRESWIYNNLLYAIANHVGEVETGQPYENLVITKIVAALGMG